MGNRVDVRMLMSTFELQPPLLPRAGVLSALQARFAGALLACAVGCAAGCSWSADRQLINSPHSSVQRCSISCT